MREFGVILADPPWAYRNGGNGAAKNHYPTMSTEAICALEVDGVRVSELAEPDSVLLLWGTWPLLPGVLQVVSAWGFEYVTGFPWIKLAEAPFVDLYGEHVIGSPTFGTGFWVRGCSEFVFVARRGKAELPDQCFVGLLSERFPHSRKPENLHQYAEALPGPYLELFARRQRSGWVTWGNEVRDATF